MKKSLVLGVATAAFFIFVGIPFVGRAATTDLAEVSRLLELISSLQKQVLVLQAQLKTLQGGGAMTSGGTAITTSTYSSPYFEAISGPTNLQVNQGGSWKISVRDNDGDLSFLNINWGDGTAGGWDVRGVTSTVFASHAYTTLGKKLINFQVRDAMGALGYASSSVYIVSSTPIVTTSTPTITVLAPNGGEVWEIGGSYAVWWSTVNIPATNEISFGIKSEADYNLDYSLSSSTSINDGYEKISVPANIPNGLYRLFIKTKVGGAIIDDMSNGPFAIITSSTPIVTMVSPNGGEKWEVGHAYPISWQAKNLPSGTWKASLILYKGATTRTIIINSTTTSPFGGMYYWSIPSDIVAASDYKVTVQMTMYYSGCTGSCSIPVYGDTSDASFSIIAATSTNQPPVITSITGPTSVPIKTAASWTVSITDPDASLKHLYVDWGDGSGSSTFPLSGGSVTQPLTYAYISSGEKTITFKAVDSGGLSSVVYKQVTVKHLPPTGSVDVTQNGYDVSFQVNAVSNPNDDNTNINFYIGDWGDVVPPANPDTRCIGGPLPVSGSQIFRHTYYNSGTFTANFAISSDDNNCMHPVGEPWRTAETRLTKTVTVSADQPPVITSVTGPSGVYVNTSNSWIVSATDSHSNLSELSVQWGDGTASKVSLGGGSITQTLTHTYTTASIKTITVTVTDANGNMSTATKSVTVSTYVQPKNTLPLSSSVIEAMQAQLSAMVLELQSILARLQQ